MPRLVIEVGPNGLTVNGPINQPILAYGMLEAAKDVIRQQIAEQETRIVKPDMLIMQRNGGKGGGKL